MVHLAKQSHRYFIDLPDQTLRKKCANLPIGFCCSILALILLGLLMLYSAGGGHWQPWLLRQSIHVALFLPVMLALALLDTRIIYRYAYWMYGLALLFLIIVHVLGVTAMGATRWLYVAGGIRLQPSECMEVALIPALARYFHNLHHSNVVHMRYLWVPLCMTILPSFFIIKQPDLGTALILVGVVTTILFATGVHIWKFMAVLGAGLMALPFFWQKLHSYQKQRILMFLNPEQDPLGAGYNIIQSKIAIGSGGIFGKGLLLGTQNQLNFLPERHTDFIFTMIAEELGFVGCLAVLCLYGVLIGYGLRVAWRAQHHFAYLVAIGFSSLLFLHVFVNVGMVMGLLPVVGKPLPFLSYGGTMMATMLMACGLLLNVHIHRDHLVRHVL